MRAALRWLAYFALAGAVVGCNVVSDSALSTTKKQGEPEPGKETALVAVGRPVSEIEGEDVEGKSLKLSDYRGKVVLLDFWGNW